MSTISQTAAFMLRHSSDLNVAKDSAEQGDRGRLQCLVTISY